LKLVNKFLFKGNKNQLDCHFSYILIKINNFKSNNDLLNPTDIFNSLTVSPVSSTSTILIETNREMETNSDITKFKGISKYSSYEFSKTNDKIIIKCVEISGKFKNEEIDLKDFSTDVKILKENINLEPNKKIGI
jgi:hypothetical protein